MRRNPLKIIWILIPVLLFSLGCSPERVDEGALLPSPTTGALDPTAPSATDFPAPTAEPTTLPAPEGVLLGVYASDFLQYAVDELVAFDHWMADTGMGITIAPTFMDFEEGNADTFVPAELDAAWDHGYLPFINLSVGNLAEPRTSAHIAEGYLDEPIRDWARAYAAWSSEGGKRAMIAPLQEMNGYWTTYGGHPDEFLGAYERIQTIFVEEGVRPEAVSWVFAPNGWSQEGYEFEKFYPGDEVVDVVAFSSFNWGECSNWPKWETYEQIFKPYLLRMTAMAPDKPIMVAETGTVAEGGDKDLWIKETFLSLATYPNFRGILYFNRWEARSTLGNCPNGTDYRIYNPEGDQGYAGFLEVIGRDYFLALHPDSPDLSAIIFTTPR